LLFKLATPEEICKELAARLRSQRLSQLMSQQELASKAGVSAGTVQSLERTGQTTLESFVRVIGALELTDDLEELFKLRVTSIAEMEQAERAQRQRAPRKVRK
jgi:transcriptional regulator with XRE-family HTH domain